MEPARHLHDPHPWDDLWDEEDDLWPAAEPEEPETDDADDDPPEPIVGPRQLSFEDLPEDLRGMHYVS